MFFSQKHFFTTFSAAELKYLEIFYTIVVKPTLTTDREGGGEGSGNGKEDDGRGDILWFEGEVGGRE